jgi:hypothetical protein
MKIIKIKCSFFSASQPNLSQYFSDARDATTTPNATPNVSFFDQISSSNLEQSNVDLLSASNVDTLSTSNVDECGEDVAESIEDRETAVLHSCRESRVDLPTLATLQNAEDEAENEAKLDVAEQVIL